MKEERIKENATPREMLAFYDKCLTHLESGGKVTDDYGTTYGTSSILTAVSPLNAIIIHEPKKEYVPYDSTTAHLIPCGAWVEHKDGRKYAISKINTDGSISTVSAANYIISPTEYSYCNSPVNGELAGKPFGVEKIIDNDNK